MKLDSSWKQEPVGKLAEVGEECFFSSVYSSPPMKKAVICGSGNLIYLFAV